EAGLTVFFVTLGCATIGFVDDYIKVTHKRSLGLAGRWKLLLLAGITAGVGWVVHDMGRPKAVFVPLLDWRLTLSYGFFVLLFLLGGIFVVEAASVILQVVSFRYWGRRLFLMAPIHHHFEMKAWSETKIMVRFWILAAILCATAFAFYYRYYLNFRGLR